MKLLKSIAVFAASGILFIMASTAVFADDLTLGIEKDLAALGYDTGPVDGEETMETVIAISKFQAENNMEVTGSVSPRLAGFLAARASTSAPQPAVAVAAESASVADEAVAPAPDATDLQAAQQACLQEKIDASQAANKKKRGFGRLIRAAARVAGRSGNYDLYETTRNVYDANATADDLAAAAKDLGLTEDDVAACQNPL